VITQVKVVVVQRSKTTKSKRSGKGFVAAGPVLLQTTQLEGKEKVP